MNDIRDPGSRLLEELQNDFPLTPHPFEEIGRRCGFSEAETIQVIRRMRSEGLIREISALLDGRKIGFQSTLVALHVLKQQIDGLAERINRHPGVSHNYLRDHHYNIWFTLSIPRERDFAETVDEIVAGAENEIMILPALRTFKLRVHLRLRRGGNTNSPDERIHGFTAEADSPVSTDEAKPPGLSGFERALLARLESPLAVEAQPWQLIASQLEVSENELFAAVLNLKNRGVIRRIAAVLRHRRVGFTANGMACFRVSDSEILQAGREAASFPDVSHCYQRKSCPQWPYSLYAMVHALKREECDALVKDISRAIGCSDYQLLYSVREYKKQRIKYFGE